MSAGTTTWPIALNVSLNYLLRHNTTKLIQISKYQHKTSRLSTLRRLTAKKRDMISKNQISHKEFISIYYITILYSNSEYVSIFLH